MQGKDNGCIPDSRLIEDNGKMMVGSKGLGKKGKLWVQRQKCNNCKTLAICHCSASTRRPLYEAPIKIFESQLQMEYDRFDKRKKGGIFLPIRYDTSIFDDSASKRIGKVSKLRSTYKKR